MRALIFIAILLLALFAVFAGGCAVLLLTDGYFGNPPAGIGMALLAALAAAGVYGLVRALMGRGGED